MRLQILCMPDCPNTAVLAERLGSLLAGRPDIQLTRHVISTEDQARQWGMTGSPTLLVDGVDPFAQAGQQFSLSCRLYLGDDGRLGPAPSARQLRAALYEP
jgi:hypothetical protein